MTALPAYSFSLLTRQLALGDEAFLRRYPYCWLVWEAGGSHGHFSDVGLSVMETSLSPMRKEPQRPTRGDALCFVLKAPDAEPLRIGRAVENEIGIAEPTVSRLHAQLLLKGPTWHLMPLSHKRSTLVGGRVADPCESVQLASGVSLELGGIRFTFYDSKAFRTFLGAKPLRSSR